MRGRVEIRKMEFKKELGSSHFQVSNFEFRVFCYVVLAAGLAIPFGCGEGKPRSEAFARPLSPGRQVKQQDVRGPIAVELSRNFKYDMGAVEQGSWHRMRFTIRNDESREVRITKIAVSCACTIATNPESIPAHGMAEILADFTAPSRAVGEYTTQLAVFTDSKEHPVILILFAADVRARH